MKRPAGHLSRRALPARAPAWALALVPLALCLPHSALAQDVSRPALAGHVFVSTDLVPDAFVRGYVSNSLGYSQTAEFNYPALVVGGDTLLALNGSLAYALLGMEYQHAIRNWIAVRVGVGMRSRLGTQLSSLVSEGVSVTSGLEFGWLVRLRETERTMLSGYAGVTKQTLTLIDVGQFTEDVIDGDPDPSLIDDVPSVRSVAALRFAWAASRPLGLTLLAQGSYG